MILVLGAIFSFSTSAKITLLFPLKRSPIKSFSSIDYNDDPSCVHNYLIYFKWILFINQLDMDWYLESQTFIVLFIPPSVRKINEGCYLQNILSIFPVAAFVPITKHHVKVWISVLWLDFCQLLHVFFVQM